MEWRIEFLFSDNLKVSSINSPFAIKATYKSYVSWFSYYEIRHERFKAYQFNCRNGSLVFEGASSQKFAQQRCERNFAVRDWSEVTQELEQSVSF